MRKVLSLVLLFCSVAQGQVQERVSISGYLPPLPSTGEPGPNYTLCDEPWVQMLGDDGVHATAWHCRPANHTCFALIGDTMGYGCHGGWLDGWVYADDATGPVMVDPRHLVVGRTYKLNGEGIPLAPIGPDLGGRTPEEVIDAIQRFVNMPAGTVVSILAVDREGRYNPWYRVALPEYENVEGWINSVALLDGGVETH